MAPRAEPVPSPAGREVSEVCEDCDVSDVSDVSEVSEAGGLAGAARRSGSVRASGEEVGTEASASDSTWVRAVGDRSSMPS